MSNNLQTAGQGKRALTPADIEHIRALRLQGRSWPFIAAQYGLSSGTLCYRLAVLPSGLLPRRRKMLSGEHLSAIARMRADGRTWDFIARALGTSMNRLIRERKALGIEYPPLPKPKRRMLATLTQADVERIKTLRLQGCSWPFIAAQYGLSRGTLCYRLAVLPSGLLPRRRKTLSGKQLAAIAAMRADGRSWEFIAHTLGIGMNVLVRERKAWGVNYPPLPNAPPAAARMTLFPNEVQAFVTMRKQGRNLEYIAAEIGVSMNVLRRELHALGYSTAKLKPIKRAKRDKGFWRSFDEPELAHLPLAA